MYAIRERELLVKCCFVEKLCGKKTIHETIWKDLAFNNLTVDMSKNRTR